MRYGLPCSFHGNLSFGLIANAEFNFRRTTINDSGKVVGHNPSVFVCVLATLTFGENLYDVHDEYGSISDARKEKHR